MAKLDFTKLLGFRQVLSVPDSTDVAQATCAESGEREVPSKDTTLARTMGATFNKAGVETSDRRLKRDIVAVGRLDNGIALYRYRYLWSNQEYVGVMAQEVAPIMPDAVLKGLDGYFRVDYCRLGLRLMTWEEWLDQTQAQAAAA